MSETHRRAALATWQDPVIREKRITGIRRGHLRSASLGRKKFLGKSRRTTFLCEEAVYLELIAVCDAKQCGYGEQIRAYIEAGLHADKDLLNVKATPPRS